ncbi:MAG: TonB-dependent receptor plug domain-containing protein [Desulfobacterales bacterium]|nr:TonB-dependent receptor plug domain-containing protein [Desulfobacterales bacterium]
MFQRKNILTHNARIVLSLIMVFIAPLTLFAEDTNRKVAELSLSELFNIEEYLNMEANIATKEKAVSIKESPAIITVITSEEIKRSGARDLIDVFRLVPGLEVVMDSQNSVSLSMRGLFTGEGKLLVKMNGAMINNLTDGSFCIGNHYSVDQIEKIEIIRGPGSAIYGGFAELGVINIITKGAKDINGVAIQAIYGQTKETYMRRDLGLSFGKKFEDTEIAFHGLIGQGKRGDVKWDYTNFNMGRFDMAKDDYSALNPIFGNLSFKSGGLENQLIVEQYSAKYPYDYSGAIFGFFQDAKLPFQKVADSPSTLVTNQMKYDIQINDKLKITPLFNIYWNKHKKTETDFLYIGTEMADQSQERYTGEVNASYNIHEEMNIQVGIEYFRDISRMNDTKTFSDSYDLDENGYFKLFDQKFKSNNKETLDFYNIAEYAQFLWLNSVANITLGARYDYHEAYGGQLSPRIAITKAIGDFYSKALFAQAFRAPTNATIDNNPNISPETLTTVEFEAGYNFFNHVLFSINLFDMRIKDPITMGSQDGEPIFENYGKIRTRGIEIDNRYSFKQIYCSVTYSYYQNNHSDIPIYEIPDDEDVFNGMPQHKVTANGHIKLFKGLSFNPSFIYISKRKTITDYWDLAGGLGPKEYGTIDEHYMLNANLLYEGLFDKHFDVSISIFNILDDDYLYTQAYPGYLFPMPGNSREIVFRMNYNYNF